MTKIKFSSFRQLSFSAMLIFLVIAPKMSAQDSVFLQKAMQSCLDHQKVRPNLKAVTFADQKNVLAVAKNRYTTEDIELTMFGQEAIIREKPDLFFYGIENYVEVEEVQTEKDKIILTFMADDHFTCSYSGKKGKVTKLTLAGSD